MPTLSLGQCVRVRTLSYAENSLARVGDTSSMRRIVTIGASVVVLALLIPGTVITAVGLVLLFLATLRESLGARWRLVIAATFGGLAAGCLLYTSDAADDLLCVDLG